MCIESPLFSFEVPLPATTDNVAAAKYSEAWRELNFRRRAELFGSGGVNTNVRKRGFGEEPVA
jgi:hypothetical protein